MYRSRKNAMFSGICGGIGESLGINPNWIRLAVFVTGLFIQFIIIPYILMWIFLPEK